LPRNNGLKEKLYFQITPFRDYRLILQEHKAMTTAVKELLSRFERLSEEEQQAAAQVILQRAAQMDAPQLSDEQLVALAEGTFLEFDQRELKS
jgi:hypothetical protein